MQIYVSPANQRRQRSANCPVSPTHFPNVNPSLLRHCHIKAPPNTNKSQNLLSKISTIHKNMEVPFNHFKYTSSNIDICLHLEVIATQVEKQLESIPGC